MLVQQRDIETLRLRNCRLVVFINVEVGKGDICGGELELASHV